MEHPSTDTQPLPVVESAAPSAAPSVAPPTVALPVDAAPLVPAPVAPRGRRDLTPVILGFLALAAVVAIALSLVALSRRDQPPTRLDPAGTGPSPTSVPAGATPGPVGPASSAAPVVTSGPGAAPSTSASTVTTSVGSTERGKGRGAKQKG